MSGSLLRAFGGGPLLGNRLLRLVYMDEAGISRDEPVLVVSAVIVHADSQLRLVEEHLEGIVRQYIPEEHQRTFVFHASQLFNGGGKVFKRNDPRWSLQLRLEIADHLAAIPRLFGLSLTAGWIKKSAFLSKSPKRRSSWLASDLAAQATMAHAVAFLMASLKVDAWMQDHTDDEICMLVVEENEQAHRVIQTNHRYNQDPRMTAELPEAQRKHLPLRTVKEDAFFQEKRPLSLLQLADFSAYVLKRHLMGDAHYARQLSPMKEMFYHTFFDSEMC